MRAIIQEIVQQKAAKEYLTAAGTFSPEISAARDFVNSTTALYYVLNHDLKDVAVVLDFSDTCHDYERWNILLGAHTDERPSP